MAVFTEPKKWGVVPGNAADISEIQEEGSSLYPSLTDFFPAIYQLALSAGGKAPERATFNALFKMIMERLYFIERGGVWSYDATADYPAGAVVGYSGSLYLALKDNGSSTDAGAVQPDADGEVWQKLPTLTDVAKAFLLISDAEADYLKKTDAADTYLSKTAAEADYLKKSDASDTYLSKNDASDTYLSKSDASDTYLSKSDAEDTYQTKEDLSSIAGITLENVECSYKKSKVKSNVLISHVGLTGPGIIDLSSKISKDLDYDILDDEYDLSCEIAIDLVPDYSREYLKDTFNKDFQDRGKTQIKNYLKDYLTNSFIEYFLKRIDIAPETQLSRINKKSKNRLFTFEINDFNKDLAKVTVGGVDLKNINPKTMESKKIPNLYFAGEVLDLDGPTGGYNLKIAFSTGYLAGLSASKK